MQDEEDDPAPTAPERDLARSVIDVSGPDPRWPHALVHAVALIDLARQPMLIVWGPDRLMFYNEAYRPILAGKPDSQGRPLLEVFPEAWAFVEDILVRAEGGESVFCEDMEVSITRNGLTEPAWWTLSCSPLPVPAGAVGGVLCIVQETTRLHRVQAELHAAQAELTQITDVMPGLLWRTDAFGRTVWQNARLRALSVASGANSGNLWRKLVHPDDIEAVLAELAVAKSERRAFSKVMRLQMHSGDYRWHLARSEPLFGEVDVLTGWCGVATDIQSSIDALEMLEQRTALFSQFAANSSGLLWTVDLASLTVDRLSPNFTTIWPDLTPGEPWTWAQFLATVHEADRPVIAAGLDLVAAGEMISGRFRIVTPAGAIRWLESSTFPIVTSDGRIPCIGGILKDVTREGRRIVYLVDDQAGSQNRLSHGLRRLGVEVTVFDSIEDLADVATGMTAGPLLYHHRGDEAALTRLAGLMKTALAGNPWLVLQDGDRPAREAVAIMKLGACDILEADSAIETLATALSTAASMIRGATVEGIVDRRPRYRLTSREYQISQGLVAGGTNKTIAQSLNISPRTVESHRSRLMERLGVDSLAELVALVTSPSFEVDIRS